MVKAIKKKKTNHAKQTEKTDAAPDHMLEPCRPEIAEKHRTSGTRTSRPQNSNPFIFKSPGDRRKRATTPMPRTETPAIADHLHQKIPKLILFNIKLFLKTKNKEREYDDSILHIPNQSS